MFITFEGIDGCGKTTQVKLLKTYFDSNQKEYISIREPGSTNISEQIRNILLDPENAELSPESEALLFASARAQIVDEIIIPTINENKIVICDRFTDSTIAYQGYGRKMDLLTLESINSFATQQLVPDFTFFIDISIEESQKRLTSSDLDRIESIGLSFFESVRNGYLELTQNYPNRIHLLDGNKSIEQIHSQIISIIS
jgi:dTMP kinase